MKILKVTVKIYTISIHRFSSLIVDALSRTTPTLHTSVTAKIWRTSYSTKLDKKNEETNQGTPSPLPVPQMI